MGRSLKHRATELGVMSSLIFSYFFSWVYVSLVCIEVCPISDYYLVQMSGPPDFVYRCTRDVACNETQYLQADMTPTSASVCAGKSS
jgi:hypothetical protein